MGICTGIVNRALGFNGVGYIQVKGWRILMPTFLVLKQTGEIGLKIFAPSVLLYE